MSKLRHLLIIGILTFVFVSACGGNAPRQPSSQVDNSSTEAVRVVKHAFGETKISMNPQRVVVLATGLDTVLSLGVNPVGSTQVPGKYFRGYDYLNNRLGEIASVGHLDSPNLEVIAALEPDLILGAKAWDSQNNYNLLSQIAPTVIAEVETSGEWERMLNKYAEALGKTDKAEQILADYHARIEEFQAQMGDRLKQTEVSIVRVLQDGLNIYLEDSSCGAIVADAGLPRPPYQTNPQNSFSMEIGKESLYKIDGDVIFAWTFASDQEMANEAQSALKQLKADPLWLKLNAVQQDEVYEVPNYWINMGPIAANLVLDDLFKYLVEE
ncbi:iron-siderophore ABC transporter substrate-binding protein [Romeria aff. gracilis LEGE 07310]|uniref:Iron-siderophore ABC transporter substrate-binding protein n=1 Tax=Vasconcelosia minhoensis LEGE 07310 TaxID=915328 RepID=A0A8J7A6D7_9CYAN|nr:iron-siderophore ABC transporter substrate-binding protein [Romeria gracilis]MBE9077522.1 iron-siderophore ABC transporter substrate-binding protein [Romeria aff. gracilis LEGE 07310]